VETTTFFKLESIVTFACLQSLWLVSSVEVLCVWNVVTKSSDMSESFGDDWSDGVRRAILFAFSDDVCNAFLFERTAFPTSRLMSALLVVVLLGLDVNSAGNVNILCGAPNTCSSQSEFRAASSCVSKLPNVYVLPSKVNRLRYRIPDCLVFLNLIILGGCI